MLMSEGEPCYYHLSKCELGNHLQDRAHAAERLAKKTPWLANTYLQETFLGIVSGMALG